MGAGLVRVTSFGVLAANRPVLAGDGRTDRSRSGEDERLHPLFQSFAAMSASLRPDHPGFSQWLDQDDTRAFLRTARSSDEVVLYATGNMHCYIFAVAVPQDALLEAGVLDRESGRGCRGHVTGLNPAVQPHAEGVGRERVHAVAPDGGHLVGAEAGAVPADDGEGCEHPPDLGEDFPRGRTMGICRRANA